MRKKSAYIEFKKELKKRAIKERKKSNEWFFKTGKGEYGEGDKFIGVISSGMREVAKDFQEMDLSQIQKALDSEIHEERQTALFILVAKFSQKPKKIAGNFSLTEVLAKRTEIYNFYLKNTKRINNWDLVDSSAHKIVGEYLLDKQRDILYRLAKSKNLWERRISIISNFAFLRVNDFEDALRISEILLNDTHDLIHKAVGWVLREVGKKSLETEEKFLKKHYKNMPRTMLRYAIEKFSEKKRLAYLKGFS